MNIPFDADYLRPLGHVFEPDERAINLVKVNVQTDAFRSIGLEDQHAAIAQFCLNPEVPRAVYVHYETAKNLYLYAWFVFRFYPIAEQQALASLEFALRERLTEFVMRYKNNHRHKQEPSLGALLKNAIQQQIIKNDAFTCLDRWALNLARDRYRFEKMQEIIDANLEGISADESGIQASDDDLKYDWLGYFLKTLPGKRNDYAHGSRTLHHTVLKTFEVVMEIINQLYPEKSNHPV